MFQQNEDKRSFNYNNVLCNKTASANTEGISEIYIISENNIAAGRNASPAVLNISCACEQKPSDLTSAGTGTARPRSHSASSYQIAPTPSPDSRAFGQITTGAAQIEGNMPVLVTIISLLTLIIQ